MESHFEGYNIKLLDDSNADSAFSELSYGNPFSKGAFCDESGIKKEIPQSSIVYSSDQFEDDEGAISMDNKDHSKYKSNSETHVHCQNPVISSNDSCKSKMVVAADTTETHGNSQNVAGSSSKAEQLANYDTSSTTEQLVCPYCTKTIKNKGSFLKHKDYCLRKISWTKKCNFCEKIFRDNYGLKRHLKVHGINLSTKTFECTFCRKCFRDNYNMSKHMDAVHKIEQINKGDFNSKVHFECSQCHSYFKDRLSLRRHTKIEHSTIVYRCTICKKKFPDRQMLNCHSFSHHSLNSSDSNDSYQICMNALSGKKKKNVVPKKCSHSSDCSECFENQPCDEKAKERLHGQLDCSLCKLLFKNVEEYEKHLFVEHSNELDFNKLVDRPSESQNNVKFTEGSQNTCVLCLHSSSRDFKFKRCSVSHLSGEGEINCAECGMSLESKKNLIFHYATKHNNIMNGLCQNHQYQMDDIDGYDSEPKICQMRKNDIRRSVKTTGQPLNSLQPLEHSSGLLHQKYEDTSHENMFECLDNAHTRVKGTDIDQESRLLYSRSLDILFRESEQFMYNG